MRIESPTDRKFSNCLLLLAFVVFVTLTDANAQIPFALPLRLEASGTCTGNGSTVQTVEAAYGATVASLPFTGTVSYDFFSPPIVTAPSLDTSDKAAGKLWLTNASTSSAGDFDISLQFLFLDYDPISGVDLPIADARAGDRITIRHQRSVAATTPNTFLTAAYTPLVGHLLHVKVIVTLLSGTASAASILFNAPSGAAGDSLGMLPQNKNTKTWAFDGLTPPPNATVSAPASVAANSTGNLASVPSTAAAAYVWTITGGSITAGQGTSQITWSAGSGTSLNLGVTVTKGCASSGSAVVQVLTANAQLPFTLGIQRNSDRTSTLTIQGPGSKQFLLQATSDLSLPQWTTIFTNVTAPSGLASFTDVDSTNYPARFYRGVMP